MRVFLGAGVFIAAAKAHGTTVALLSRVRGRQVLCVVAATIAEFYRGGAKTAREAQLLNRWRPDIVSVTDALARRAGMLLAETGGTNVLDALLVAGAAACGASAIYTTDVEDIERLASADSALRSVLVVKAD